MIVIPSRDWKNPRDGSAGLSQLRSDVEFLGLDAKLPSLLQRKGQHQLPMANPATHLPMSRKRVLENDIAPLLHKRRLVRHVRSNLRYRFRLDRLLEHFRQVFNRLLQVGLVVLEQGGTVALLETARRLAALTEAPTRPTSKPSHRSISTSFEPP